MDLHETMKLLVATILSNYNQINFRFYIEKYHFKQFECFGFWNFKQSELIFTPVYAKNRQLMIKAEVQ